MLQPPLGRCWLLTGITGFLGSYLAAELLWRTGGRCKILALVRDSDRASPLDRVVGSLEPLIGTDAFAAARESIKVLPGDVTLPRLGLDAACYRSVSEQASVVIHAAASISFGAALDRSRAINVEGTRRVLALVRDAARIGPAPRFVYVSTAYVSGSEGGVLHANQLSLDRPFTNAYERSKAEAESLVREQMSDLSATIIRPSIVIGDSISGYTKELSTVYYGLRLIHHDLLPCAPDGALDCVPVDYVTRGILAAACAPSAIGRTFHLTAGFERRLQWGRVAPLLLDCVARATGKRPRHRVLSREDYLQHFADRARLSPRQQGVLEQFHLIYAPYLLQEPKDFQDEETRLLMGGDRPPEPDTMAPLIAGYCLETKWGTDPRGHSAFGQVISAPRRLCA